MQSIAPLLIILRVAQGRAWSKDTMSRLKTPIQFYIPPSHLTDLWEKIPSQCLAVRVRLLFSPQSRTKAFRTLPVGKISTMTPSSVVSVV
ncbi:hypothetical protein CPB84DRAFT_1041528 [Gymnopilus junonius]|uniref:Uncharacterized protein n=1 Tax=Gymnopilus junonius TaxID=109634 RepID=A0A9P5NNK8_GYMJU|nr:hypothetical protein CPB84DRAFT_1041528 [Gymnopilus junonius]